MGRQTDLVQRAGQRQQQIGFRIRRRALRPVVEVGSAIGTCLAWLPSAMRGLQGRAQPSKLNLLEFRLSFDRRKAAAASSRCGRRPMID